MTPGRRTENGRSRVCRHRPQSRQGRAGWRHDHARRRSSHRSLCRATDRPSRWSSPGSIRSTARTIPMLRDALDRLQLNDASLTYEPESSLALGFGFRAGFLGLLHMEIIQERLEREYDIDLLATAPSVEYDVDDARRASTSRSTTPPTCRPQARSKRSASPGCDISVISPIRYIGTIMELVTGRRGTYHEMVYLDEERVQLKFDMPLGELIVDFYDQLKSRTQGYASLDYTFRRAPRGAIWSSSTFWSTAHRSTRFRSSATATTPTSRGRESGASLRKSDPAPDVRCPDSGIDRQPDHCARDDSGHAQERDLEVLRRRHLAQAQAARKAERGQGADEDGRVVEIPQEAFMAVLSLGERQGQPAQDMTHAAHVTIVGLGPGDRRSADRRLPKEHLMPPNGSCSGPHASWCRGHCCRSTRQQLR